MGMTTRQQTAIQASIYRECAKFTTGTDSIAEDMKKLIDAQPPLVQAARSEDYADIFDALATIKTAQRMIRLKLPMLF